MNNPEYPNPEISESNKPAILGGLGGLSVSAVLYVPHLLNENILTAGIEIALTTVMTLAGSTLGMAIGDYRHQKRSNGNL